MSCRLLFRSIFDQLRVQQQHGEAIGLAKTLLGELLDPCRAAIVKPQVGVALFNLRQLARPEEATPRSLADIALA